MKGVVWMGAAAAVALAAGTAWAQADVIAERRAGLKRMGEHMQAMKAVVDSRGNVQPLAATASMLGSDDVADDVCVWTHPSNGARSLVIGVNKSDARHGGLAPALDLPRRIERTCAGVARRDRSVGAWPLPAAVFDTVTAAAESR